MPQFIGTVSLLVRDYDEAIAFYRDVLGFELLEDTQLSPTKRWVVVAPPCDPASSAAATRTGILLAKAFGEEQASMVGKQAAGRVLMILRTDDFDRDFKAYTEKGVVFRDSPRHETYGKVAVFLDLYGTPWDLLELFEKKE